jgi:hypothetical protein
VIFHRPSSYWGKPMVVATPQWNGGQVRMQSCISHRLWRWGGSTLGSVSREGNGAESSWEAEARSVRHRVVNVAPKSGNLCWFTNGFFSGVDPCKWQFG